MQHVTRSVVLVVTSNMVCCCWRSA